MGVDTTRCNDGGRSIKLDQAEVIDKGLGNILHLISCTLGGRRGSNSSVGWLKYGPKAGYSELS